MRRLLCGVVLATAFTPQAMAAPKSFALVDPSGQYLVEVLFPEVPQDPQTLAQALITLRDRQSLEPLQQLQTQMDSLPDEDPESVNDWLSGPYGLLSFGDFNFDGRQDVAIRDATQVMLTGNYRYTVYLQDEQQAHWVQHNELTALARETVLGMFDVDTANRQLVVLTNRGCCASRSARWQFTDGKLVQHSSVTQEEIPADLDGRQVSMPPGYLMRTRGAWQDGQWRETRNIEGPQIATAQKLNGTLDGKLPVQLWFQDQGAVVIGELRYTRSGSGAPIRLVGERGEYDGLQYLYLFEFADDGHQTGIWSITPNLEDPGTYTGYWVDKSYTQKPELPLLLRHGGPEPAADKLGDVPAGERSGRYQMLADFLQRNGQLDLAILPERDAQGREVAEFTLTLSDAKTGTQLISEHHRLPIEAGNLILVREGQASKGNGPYHIQLVKGFAVVKYNAAPDNPQMMTGMYRKQP
ncbi:XAC2610-related protein [Pseudomonas sp. NPDC089406]|uniref:XAC2610-related protein n=1 Tax=Pseudomonas sp. NPDC089406 TaxID=3364463 RepID=UPI00384F8453